MSILKQLIKKIFQYEAKLVLKKYNPKIITITGSVGKTITRDTLYGVLSKKFFVRKSEKSFTTELGVPLTIIGSSNGRGTISEWLQNIVFGFWVLFKKEKYPDILILEIDGDKPGDIENISKWVKPDILVITEIGEVPSHIESFNSDMEKFLGEKKKLLEAVKRDGVVFYNADDEVIGRLMNDFTLTKVSCGLVKDCDVFGSDFQVLSGTMNGIKIPTGMTFDVEINTEKFSVNAMDTIGVSNEYATLLSLAVANNLGVSIKESVSIINKLATLPGRMKIISGIKDTVIIDDSYNSSPIAMKQAVDALFRVDISGRKIVVVGDMLELGKFSTNEHRAVARLLRDTANYVICVGLRSRKGICDELLSLGFDESNILSVDTSEEAGKFLQNMIQAGDIILVKGSQSMRMEKVVEEVMRHPEDKEKLLVRQEVEWVG